ncbi:MAG: lectin-like protein [Planctomycetota bacterium]|nr:lectin-like protein [Planctomycetota bacterium]
MIPKIALFGVSLALLSSTPTFGQGSDACGSAQLIAGTGVFNFDNTSATTDGTSVSLCLAFGTSNIENDVWFEWASPLDSFYNIDVCNGQTAVDTKIAVYDGSCTGAVIACNDDSCGLQSMVAWAATASSTYVFRIGTFPGAVGGTGTFSLTESGPVQNPANGHYYQAIPQVSITWADADAAATASSHQGLAGHLVTITDQAENDFVFALGDVQNYWTGGYQDLNDPNYSEPAGAWKWITGEPMVYTNWLAGEPNNTGCCGSEDFMELLQGGSFGTTWNDVHPLEHSRGYVVEYDATAAGAYCFGDGSGSVCPCGNPGGTGEGCSNSTGAGATILATGSSSVSADDLGFMAAQLLPFQPALLFSGDNAVNNGDGVVFGDGLRCAGGAVKRLGVRNGDASGDASWGPGLAILGGWQPGDTKRFQTWYRDPGGSPCGSGFNLSHGLEVAFMP